MHTEKACFYCVTAHAVAKKRGKKNKIAGSRTCAPWRLRFTSFGSEAMLLD